jgi:hypothetical protein
VLSLAKNLTFLGADGNSWARDWERFPDWCKRVQLAGCVKCMIGTSLVEVLVQTTWDMDMALSVGAFTASSVGQFVSELTPQALGPYVRARFEALSSGQAFSAMTLSAWLTPKAT